MTIGEGVFWSTVLVLSFVSLFLITKKRKWKSVGKISAVVAVLMVLAVGGFTVYVDLQNRPAEVSELQGVELGMTPVEVTLLKGKPTAELEPEQREGQEHFIAIMSYGENWSDRRLAIAFRGPADQLAVDLICEKGGYGKLLGIGSGSTEAYLKERLGLPDSESIASDGLAKWMNYPQWNTSFQISRGRVKEVCVTSRSAIRFSEEYQLPNSN